MTRRLFAGFLGAALIAAAGTPDTPAQDKKETPKKEQPKKKERIAIADPEKAKADPDFAIQGEYEGTLKGIEDEKVGAQVIAQGEGQFRVRILRGGLPGAGWNGKDSVTLSATRTDGKVVIREGKDDIGSIDNGSLTVAGKDKGKFAITARKVERKSPTLGARPPEGAVVLFGMEGDEKQWDGGNLVKLSDGTFLGVGIKSKQKFAAFKAHVEFRTPWMPNSTGQGRGNSGVYFQDRYECQVLDSFGLSGENNECGGIYTQHKPKVNMCLPPLSWQTYDIEFTPAQFEGDKKVKNGRATIYHNGVKIHDDVEFPKECPGGQKEAAAPGPFQFQNHGDPVVYRNVWVVEVK